MHEPDEPVFQTTDQIIIGWRNNNRLCFAINYFSYLSFFLFESNYKAEIIVKIGCVHLQKPVLIPFSKKQKE
jgi:hypothetical protein